MKKSKYSHLSTDQLEELKQPKNALIHSKIKEQDLFIRYTAEKDIAKVFYPDIPFPRVPLPDLERIFNHLKAGGFIEKAAGKGSTTIPIYKCIKRWNSNDLQQFPKTRP